MLLLYHHVLMVSFLCISYISQSESYGGKGPLPLWQRLKYAVGHRYAGKFPSFPQEMDCSYLEDGLYPNPTDCLTYYKCKKYISYPLKCPHPQEFHDTKRHCTLPEPNSGCQQLHGTQSTKPYIHLRYSNIQSREAPPAPSATTPATGSTATAPITSATPTSTTPLSKALVAEFTTIANIMTSVANGLMLASNVFELLAGTVEVCVRVLNRTVHFLSQFGSSSAAIVDASRSAELVLNSSAKILISIKSNLTNFATSLTKNANKLFTATNVKETFEIIVPTPAICFGASSDLTSAGTEVVRVVIALKSVISLM